MKRHLFVILSGALFALSISSVQAASECKGLDQTACSSNPACTWVSGYVRKDGKEVAAHCKAKGAAKGAVKDAGAAKAPAPAPAPAPEATKK